MCAYHILRSYTFSRRWDFISQNQDDVRALTKDINTLQEENVKRLTVSRQKRRTRKWNRIDYHADEGRCEKRRKMLDAMDAEQSANNSVIVSQLASSHTPQDFTVSRLLSTSTQSLGKDPKILLCHYKTAHIFIVIYLILI